MAAYNEDSHIDRACFNARTESIRIAQTPGLGKNARFVVCRIRLWKTRHSDVNELGLIEQS